MATVDISVISPVYLGEASLAELVRQIRRELDELTPRYEIVLVEDGSPDDSWARIEEECRRDPRVKGIRLSRNFGQHHALTAGLEASVGERVIVLDCDLQDDPRYIPDLVRLASDGFDIVFTRKRERVHQGFTHVFGPIFHGVLNLLVPSDRQRTDSRVGNYSILSRRVVEAFLRFRDCHRHYLGILRWLGFPHTYLDIEHRERAHGSSSYSLSGLIRQAIVGVTTESDRLLYLSVGAGFALFIASFLGAVLVVIRHFLLDAPHPGWASLFVLLLASTGAILTSTGVLGIYVGKIFDQTRRRPLYFVQERLNIPSERARPVPESEAAPATGVLTEEPDGRSR